MINFLQINLNKAEVAHTELLRRLGEQGETIALVQEPYRHRGQLARAPRGYSRIPSAQIEKSRACIFTANSLNLVEFSTLCSADCVAGAMKVNGRQTIFASVYLDGTNQEVVTNELRRVVKTAEQKNFGLVIGIDTNSHLSLIHI